jgi:hypothetical protein
MEIFRHGGEAHVMRPDGVMRTSVLQPMVGYQPQVDVEEVTRAFTQGPFLATRMAQNYDGPSNFAGLFGLGQPGPIQRLGLRIQAWFASIRARKGMAGLGMPGPAYYNAQSISPQLMHSMHGVMSIMSDNHGPGFPNEQANALARRSSYFYGASR